MAILCQGGADRQYIQEYLGPSRRDTSTVCLWLVPRQLREHCDEDGLEAAGGHASAWMGVTIPVCRFLIVVTATQLRLSCYHALQVPRVTYCPAGKGCYFFNQ